MLAGPTVAKEGPMPKTHSMRCRSPASHAASRLARPGQSGRWRQGYGPPLRWCSSSTKAGLLRGHSRRSTRSFRGDSRRAGEPYTIVHISLLSGILSLGWDEWFDLLYRKNKDLFGDGGVDKLNDAGDRLVKWYRGRLKDAFGHVTTAREVQSTTGRPLYYLIFAGPNKKGAAIADHVLQQGARRVR